MPFEKDHKPVNPGRYSSNRRENRRARGKMRNKSRDWFYYAGHLPSSYYNGLLLKFCYIVMAAAASNTYTSIPYHVMIRKPLTAGCVADFV